MTIGYHRNSITCLLLAKKSLIAALGAYEFKNGTVKFFVLSTFDNQGKTQLLAKFK